MHTEFGNRNSVVVRDYCNDVCFKNEKIDKLMSFVVTGHGAVNLLVIGVCMYFFNWNYCFVMDVLFYVWFNTCCN